MATYTEHQQRMLDQEFNAAQDRRHARSTHDPVMHDLAEHFRNLSRGEALDAAYEAHMDILCDTTCGDFGDVTLALENDDDFADALRAALKLARDVQFGPKGVLRDPASNRDALAEIGRLVCWRVLLAADVVATREAEKGDE